MRKRNVIIDTDPGVDDALALLLALRSRALNVVGITTVAGNVAVDQVSRNALVAVEHSGKAVPVFRGASGPLLGPLRTSEYAHGRDGLGDVGFSDPASRPQPEHAVDFIIRSAMEADEPLDLITLGPLTNLALALLTEPRIRDQIRSLVMMVGAWSVGNVTQVAEFNAAADPEAAGIVFRSGIPKTMVPLEPIRDYARIRADDVVRLEQVATSWCQMSGRLLRRELDRRPRSYVAPCDPAAVAIAIDPSIAQMRRLPVVVETRGEHTRGMTVVDMRPEPRESWPGSEGLVDVVASMDEERYRRLYTDTLLA